MAKLKSKYNIQTPENGGKSKSAPKINVKMVIIVKR